MGLHNLDLIVQKLMQIGKNPKTPIAVISKGTTKDQKTIISTLQDITHQTKELPTPALIVVGEVVNLRKSLNWFEKEINAH